MTSCQVLVMFCFSSLRGVTPSFLLMSASCLSLAASTWDRVRISSSTCTHTNTHKLSECGIKCLTFLEMATANDTHQRRCSMLCVPPKQLFWKSCWKYWLSWELQIGKLPNIWRKVSGWIIYRGNEGPEISILLLGKAVLFTCKCKRNNGFIWNENTIKAYLTRVQVDGVLKSAIFVVQIK